MKMGISLSHVKQFFGPVFGLKLFSAEVEFDDKRQPVALVLRFEKDGEPIKSLRISLKKNGTNVPALNIKITSIRDQEGDGGE